MTTPAMPELPEPELGYIETDKSRQPAFSARQMREALQSQPAAAVSDEEIWGLWDSQERTGLVGGPCPVKFARAILALRPAQQAPEWDGGKPANLQAAARDADEWLALIQRLNDAGRWLFSQPDSRPKLDGCRAALSKILCAPAQQAVPMTPASRDVIMATRTADGDADEWPEPWAYRRGWNDAEEHHHIRPNAEAK